MWTLRFAIFAYVICNYVIPTKALKVGFCFFLNFTINSLSDASKCCDWPLGQ